MTDTFTVPPMPATNCPSWCTLDHPADWARAVGHVGPYRIPKTDGTVAEGEITLEWVTENWHDTLTHLAHTASGSFTPESQAWLVDLSDSQAGLCIYVDAEGTATAADVRHLAAALLEAADKLEEITR